MLIVSSEIVSPGVEGEDLFLMVILTARSAVFICGETDVMVPWTMVPFFSSIVTVSLAHFMRNLQSSSQQAVAIWSASRRTGRASSWRLEVALKGKRFVFLAVAHALEFVKARRAFQRALLERRLR
jgi:hypothetical protein